MLFPPIKTAVPLVMLLYPAPAEVEFPPMLTAAPPAPPPAATDAVMTPPALVPNVTLFALEKLSVLKVNDPLLALAATGCVLWVGTV
jgi:hypothetical protein